ATARCFLELVRLDVISADAVRFSPEQVKQFKEYNPDVVKPAGVSVKAQVNKPDTKTKATSLKASVEDIGKASGIKFSHLHVHTQYSILDGAAKISKLVRKASLDNMPALAITDHGNMFGVKDFHQNILSHNAEVEKANDTDPEKINGKIAKLKIELAKENSTNKRKEIKEEISAAENELENLYTLRKASILKPVIGCEFYVSHRSMHKKEDKSDGSGHHLILLAKNLQGYQNLMKMTSLAYLEGFYYHPRIDKDILKQHKEGLIAMSACLGGELAQTIMNQGEENARKVVEEFREMFGEDYYFELQRHPSEDPRTQNVFEDQKFVNSVLQKFSKEYSVKTVATNDVHFVDKPDAESHDRLICISTNKDVDDEKRMRYTRQEWLKTQDEMREMFSDFPDALDTTNEIVEKIDIFGLNRE
ncbi:MAG TPA: PHP domain-containing protein, partial [Bacteroidales bacterium]|nr:PHP domain-containing protein [Bacteroidales bacterium]